MYIGDGMGVKTFMIQLPETKEGDILDLSDIVEEKVSESGFKEGFVLIFVPGSTAAVTTTEYEPGLKKDIPLALDRLFPRDIYYHHEETWHDGNGHSHVRASFIGPDLIIPFSDGRPLNGTWQQPVFLELDNKPRHRKLVIQVWGE